MPKYIAEFMPQMECRFDGDIYPTSPKGETRWDVSAFIAEEFTDEEVEHMLSHGYDYTTDRLRDDPRAPVWVREWDGPFEVVLERGKDP